MAVGARKKVASALYTVTRCPSFVNRRAAGSQTQKKRFADPGNPSRTRTLPLHLGDSDTSCEPFLITSV